MKKGFLGALAIVVLFVLSASSCSDSGTSPTSAGTSKARAPFAVGAAMTNDAKQSVKVVSFKRPTPAPEFMAPAAGHECMLVTLALANGDSHTWTMPLFEMTVVDANGQSYNQSFSCGTSSSVDSLVPKGAASAQVYFEVPTGSALKFTWTPSSLNPDSTYQTDLK